MIKAVIFDVDNTLIDFMKMKRLSCEEAISAMIDAGLPMEKEQAVTLLFRLYEQHGLEHQHIFEIFLQQAMGAVNPTVLAAGIVAYRRIKASFLEPYPHTFTTLLALKQKGLKLAVLSDAPQLEVYTRLAASKLMPFFDVILTHDDTRSLKPDGKAFRLALRELGVKAEEAIMVGDWVERDIDGAKQVGMKTAYAKYGSLHPVDAEADYTLASVQDLVRILRAS